MQQLQELLVCLVGTFQLVTFEFTFLVAGGHALFYFTYS